MSRTSWSIVLSLLVAAAAFGQTSASLTGTVTADGVPLAGIGVTVTSPALQGERSVTTTEAGTYLFSALPPGAYDVAFRLSDGREVKKHARLVLAQTARVDVNEATITVTAAPPPVLETPQVATNLTLAEVERLPVQRNQLATAQLAPGVTANTFTNGTLQVSGGPGYDNLVLVNGVVVNENTRGQMRPMYVEDAISETTLITGAIPAEYGRFTGGVISTITRSGGDELSGSLRDSLTNPAWSAASPAGEERPDTLNHVWEGTFGGFALRERLWFFSAGRWAKNDTARQTVLVPGAPPDSRTSYSESNDQKRYEVKLTARLHPRHDLVGTWFAIDTKGENVRFTNNLAVYDTASLAGRDNPESLVALHYSGVFTDRLLVEAQYSRRTLRENTGSTATDPIGGTVLLDRGNGNARFHSPTGCACDTDRADNDDVLVKASWLLPTERFGDHHFVAGADRFTERRFANDKLSGSDFWIFASRVAYANGQIYPVVTPTTQNGGGSFIRWNPVLAPADENRLRTDSLFATDEWFAGVHWSVTAGLRWDRNDALDADGARVSAGSRISPRLGVQFDVAGDGRHRISASYGEYTSHIADGIASLNQAAGNPASIDFLYAGPPINANNPSVPASEVIRLVLEQLDKQGGTANTARANLRPNGQRVIPGYNAYFDDSLSSPYVRELTAGYGVQLGANGYARADLIARDWRDLYAASVTRDTRHLSTPLGIAVDPILVTNSSNLERTYRAVQLQGRWASSRVRTGADYTWAKLRGNDDGETGANGASASLDPSIYYPELMQYARFAPEGYLHGDQRHRLRAWADADVPIPASIGRLSVSVLETYDSGLAYSASGPVNVTRYSGAPPTAGYNAVPNGQYFFSERGAFRTDDVTSTNLAVRYARNVIGGAELFVQGDLLNVFNEDAIADPVRISTTVITAATSASLQPFDPFTDTPVEGTHYQRAANFGQALNNLAYQTPRTYRVSFGVRF